MIIDCHVHISAMSEGHGFMSRRLLNSLPFRFMRWRLGMKGADERTERQLEATLARTIAESGVDKAVVLAFDGVHDDDGRLDVSNTHLYVTNDYVMELADRHDNMLFGASVHPYRRDAIAELERCVAGGAVLMKWLPPAQGMNPSDPRCMPFYEALVHHGLPLLCHTGGEASLPRVDDRLADPKLLEPALKVGVTVIMAHCGTRSMPGQPDYLQDFVRMAETYEHCYGDTAALALPVRGYALDAALRHPVVRRKVIHGSDWPIIALPSVRWLGVGASWRLMRETNWMRRDVLIKRALGFDQAYWTRAASILRLPRAAGAAV